MTYLNQMWWIFCLIMWMSIGLCLFIPYLPLIPEFMAMGMCLYITHLKGDKK